MTRVDERRRSRRLTWLFRIAMLAVLALAAWSFAWGRRAWSNAITRWRCRAGRAPATACASTSCPIPTPARRTTASIAWTTGCDAQGRQLFVTPGIGTSILPLRFGVPPEISRLTLRSVPSTP